MMILNRLVIAACAALASTGQDRLPDKGAPSSELTVETSAGSASRTVVFYNVENLFDPKDDPGSGDDDFTPNGKMHWTEERYEHKLHQLAEAISMAGEELPLMIGLCEVENRQVVEDLAKTPPLDRGHYIVVHKDSPDERGIDVALLVSKDKATVLAQDWLTVDLGTDRTRDILHASISFAKEVTVQVFVNHWPSRLGGEAESAPKRMKAAQRLRAAVDELLAKNPNERTIIMGDLNDEPLNASLKNGLLTDELVSDDHGADLYDLVGMDKQEPVGSSSYNGKWQYFDHLIVSRSLVWPESKGDVHAISAASVKDPHLIFHHPKNGDQPNRTFSSGSNYHPDGYSDHLPVVLRLE
jgi:predicted extracellular nuclease